MTTRVNTCARLTFTVVTANKDNESWVLNLVWIGLDQSIRLVGNVYPDKKSIKVMSKVCVCTGIQ